MKIGIIGSGNVGQTLAKPKPIVAALIEDAEFEPVHLGTLTDSCPLDPFSAIGNKVSTAHEVCERLAQIRQTAYTPIIEGEL
jgi:predicted dinucleotide-binding enzyme